MIFYEVEDGSNGHYLVGTQADAKREARERKCTWAQVDVPTDKAGLMAYVNQLRVGQQLAKEVEPVSGLTRDEIVQSNEPEAQAAARRIGDGATTFAPQVRPQPRMFPSEPTVDLMVDMIDEGKIDARGLSNLAESIAHRYEKISKEMAA